MKLPGRSTAIGGLKTEHPFHDRKGKIFSPALAQKNKAYKFILMK